MSSLSTKISVLCPATNFLSVSTIKKPFSWLKPCRERYKAVKNCKCIRETKTWTNLKTDQALLLHQEVNIFLPFFCHFRDKKRAVCEQNKI